MTPVSELLALKIENVMLKIQQLERIASALKADANALVEEARKEVAAPLGHLYNTDTKQFQPPDQPAPFRAPLKRQRKRVA